MCCTFYVLIYGTLFISEGVVSCTNEEITVKATAPDKKCEILVNGGDLETPIKLNVGETMVTVTVKSVDGKNTKVCLNEWYFLNYNS